MSAASIANLGVVPMGLWDRDEVEHDDGDNDFDEDVEELGIGGGRGEEIDFLGGFDGERNTLIFKDENARKEK